MKYLTRLAGAAALAGAVLLSPMTPAEAGKNGAIAGALIGGLALGAILSNQHQGPSHYAYESPRTCYNGPTQCRWVQRCWNDRWGNYRCANKQECFNPVNCY